MEKYRASYLAYKDPWNEKVTFPCLVLCAIFFLILGILPIVPDRIVELLKPFFLVICVLFRGHGYYRIGYEKWLVVLMIYLFVIWVANLGVDHSIRPYASMLLFALFFLFAANRVWTEREIFLILVSVTVICSFYSIIILLSNGGLIHSSGDQHIRFFSRYLNRNSSAFSVAPGVICALYLFFYTTKGITGRIYYLIVFGICYFTVIALSCRSAFLAASLGAFLVIWEATGSNSYKGSRLFRHFVIIVVAFLMLLVAMNVLDGTISARLFDYSDSGRDDIWDAAIELIKKKPVFGGGFGYWEKSGQIMSPHNTVLNIMLISGYVGGVIFGVFVFSMVIECYRKQSVVAIAFAMEMIFHSISEAGLDYYAYIPLVLATIILRFHEFQRQPRNSFISQKTRQEFYHG